MITLKVYSQDGQEMDPTTIDEQLLGGKVHVEALRQALLMYEANRRVGLANTKGVGDVNGSGQKMYRQKGTGRARAGQRRSPVRIGGGVAHGPHPKSWRQKMPVKVRRLALMSALLGKMQGDEVIVLDRLDLAAGKTREVAAVMRNLGVGGKFLLVTADCDKELVRCTRNIAGASISDVASLNAWGVVVPPRVIFLKDALERLSAQLTAWQEIGMRRRTPSAPAVAEE